MTPPFATAAKSARPAARPTPHRPATPPRPLIADGFAALVGIGLGAVIAAVVQVDGLGALRAPGGVLDAIGRLTGFAGGYLLLVMLLLAARLPGLERAVGHDRLLRLHRRVAPAAISSIIVHVVTITLGYAAAAKTGFLAQLWSFVTNYPDMLMASAALALLLLAAVTSVRIARRRMAYETWWVVHLYTYLALALAFGHELSTGVVFIGHPLTRALWIAAWIAAAGAVLGSRVLLPVVRNLRMRLRIVAVEEETPGVYSVVFQGHHLERLAVSGGQFFHWRFLKRHLWWQAHPYSLSALPRPPHLRVTIKASGDHGAAVSALRPGTRVFVEGPYGAFTHHARKGQHVLLIGAGVGMTPIRALLEDLPVGTDVIVVYRASSEEDMVHRQEVADLVKRLGGTLHEILGPREAERLNATRLAVLVPDVDRRDVYVCGPDSFGDEVTDAVRRLGARDDRIHRELFSF